MDQFLNPKSMMTPGFAGGLMMLVANAVCFVFPEVAFRYVALALSLLIGFVVVSAAEAKPPARAAYWLVNSLVIFAMGVGATNIGANIAGEPPAASQSAAPTAQAVEPASISLISEAYAEEKTDKDTKRDETKGQKQQGFFKRW